MERLNSRSVNQAESQLRKDLDQMRLTAGNAGAKSDGMRGYHDYKHSLGDELRGRRASMGKGLLDVHKELGIKPWIIVSIEKADPKSFDSPWMIAPLVKSYARYLGMNAEEAYARFQAEGNSETKAAGGTGRLPKLKVSGHAIRRSSAAANLAILSDQGFSRVSGASPSIKVSAAAVFSSVVVAALCAGIIYLVWTVYMDFQRIEIDPGSRPFAGAVDSAVPTSTVTVPPRVRQEPPKGFGNRTGIAELNPDDQGVYTNSQNGDSTGTEFAEASGSPMAEPNSGAEEQIELSAPLVEEPARIAIVGSRDVWVRVYNRYNTAIVVKESVLKAGEEFVVPMEGGPYFLRTGRSLNTYFRLGALVYGPVPRDKGTVVDNIELTVDAIVAGYPLVEWTEASDEVQQYVFAEE